MSLMVHSTQISILSNIKTRIPGFFAKPFKAVIYTTVYIYRSLYTPAKTLFGPILPSNDKCVSSDNFRSREFSWELAWFFVAQPWKFIFNLLFSPSSQRLLNRLLAGHLCVSLVFFSYMCFPGVVFICVCPWCCFHMCVSLVLFSI